MNYIHVRNLEKYHPGYKDRDLSWCKTYFKMLHADPDFEMLGEVDKWRFIAFVIMELQSKNPIPLQDDYLIRKGFDLKKRPISETLKMLQKFVEVVTEDSIPCTLEEDKDLDKELEKKKIKSAFAPPSTDEVVEFFKTQNAPKEQALNFHDYYASNGWRVGRAAQVMKDWQAAARGWIRRAPQFSSPSIPQTDGVPEHLKRFIKPEVPYGRR